MICKYRNRTPTEFVGVYESDSDATEDVAGCGDHYFISARHQDEFDFRLWDIEIGSCLHVLEGHEELVRCIRFDGKRIVSGAYDWFGIGILSGVPFVVFSVRYMIWRE